jgi:hypothetical protein
VLALEVGAPAGAALLCVDLVAVGGGNASPVRLALERGGSRSTAEARVSARQSLRAAIPAEHGRLHVTLERCGPGPIVAVGGAEFLARVGDERRAGLALGARALTALLAWQALAFGLGAWMRTEVAAGLVLSLALLACALPGAPLTGADLPSALELAGQGLVPGRLGQPTLGAALSAFAGLALARAGLGARRPA